MAAPCQSSTPAIALLSPFALRRTLSRSFVVRSIARFSREMSICRSAISLRIARSLNLTGEVCDGILTHTGRVEPATLEGKIVRLVDRVAYINHDIDDALRAGVIALGDLPADETAILGDTGSHRIDTLVHDLVEHSERAGDIVQGEPVGSAMLNLRAFMFERVYLGPTARAEHLKIERVLLGLFDWYVAHPDELPPGVDGAGEADRVTDYLAGMTDRFAIRAWTVRAVPQGLGLAGA